jgi:putative ABC transport system substrate-binding protein
MKRRTVLAALGGTAAAWPASAQVQQKPLAVIGSLNGNSPSPFDAKLIAAFWRGLSEMGYVEGQNAAGVVRWAEGVYERLPGLAADLVDRKVNVITTGSLPGTLAARNATSSIPIVFALGGDPVASGLVASLARPGGNITGVSILNVELVPKRVELLADLVPQAKTIALLVNPNNTNAEIMSRAAEDAGRRKDIKVEIVKARSEREIDSAFEAMVQLGVRGLVVGTDPLFATQRAQITNLANGRSIPTVFGFPTEGALLSYGTSLTEVYRQVGLYTGRILKGELPSELPVLQPTKFDLTLNLRAAKSLGIPFPDSLLASADEVIE